MEANEARKITDNHEHYNAEKWYDEYKYKIFDKIKGAALKGNETVYLSSDEWKNNDYMKKYLIFNLQSLGYTVRLDHRLIISW